MAGVSHHGRHRHIVGKNLVVRIEDGAALSRNDLFTDMLFRGQTRIFVMLDQLEVNEPKRESAEERDKKKTDHGAAYATVPFHLPARSLITG